VLCFDSDNAGQNAAVRSLDSLLASGLAIRVAVVPAPHDPDSFIKQHGGEAFKQLIDKAEGFFDFYLNYLCATNDVNSDKGRLIIIQAMAEAVHKTGNSVLIDKYAQKTALRLGVSPESMRAEFQKAARLKRPAPAGPETEVPPAEGEELPADIELTPPSAPEFWLIKLLFAHEDLVPWLQAHLDLKWIQHSQVRHIVERCLAEHADGSWQGVAHFISQCEYADLRDLVSQAGTGDRPIANPAQQLADIVLKLRNQHLDRQLTQLTQRASQPGLSEDAAIEILREQQALRNLKRKPLAPLNGGTEEPF